MIQRTSSRLCACGCGHAIAANAPGKRIWASDACRQRGHRGREKVRATTRAASVAAAVAARGDPDLRELLDVAVREAQRRPGSVMLRVAGRLVLLSAEQLRELAAALDGAAPAPQPHELAQQLRDPVELLARAASRLSSWPELDSGVRLVPGDEILGIQAQVERLRGAMALAPTSG